MKRIVFLATALSVGALSSACTPARSTAATQPTPASFDPTKSDADALALADQVMTALGGEANWAKAHELIWFQAVIVDGKVLDASYHAWDRWNARHAYRRVSPAGKFGVGTYEFFGDGRGQAFNTDPDGTHVSDTPDRDAMIKEARRRFDTDAYPLSLPYKIKDPGVHLKLDKEPREDSAKVDVLAITFDDGVGPSSKDTWYLVVDKSSHLPTQIERHAGGKPESERSGFTLEQWTEVGGLKFATVRKTLGYTKAGAPTVAVVLPKEWKDAVPQDLNGFKAENPGEIVVVKGLKVNAEPTDFEYVRRVE